MSGRIRWSRRPVVVAATSDERRHAVECVWATNSAVVDIAPVKNENTAALKECSGVLKSLR